MEMVEEVEKQWKTVNNKKKKNGNENPLLQRPWDALPSLALLKIIKNLNFKDRLVSFPYVCKAWNSVISNDPRCWSSMVPESISPEDFFIKKPVYSVHVNFPYKLFYGQNHPVLRDANWDDPIHSEKSILWRLTRPGVSLFRNLIKKSSTSASLGSSTITSLYLDPFHFDFSDYYSLSFNYTNYVCDDYDEILGLIAHHCPNLKHISFDGFYHASSIEAVLQVFHKCNKIELIDFSDSWYANSVQVIEELGNCLPNLRGLRMGQQWRTYYSIHDVFARHLPRIKLLAVECNGDEDFGKLTSGTECCLYELQHLSLGLPYYDIIHRDHLPVCNHIPEFHYEGHRFDYEIYCDDCRPVHPSLSHECRYLLRRRCYSCYRMKVAEEEEEAAEKTELLEHLHIEEKNKEDEYNFYVSILKEKKKSTRRNHRYVVSKTRMGKNKKEVSFILKMKMRKKRDKYDYQDFYVQTALSHNGLSC